MAAKPLLLRPYLSGVLFTGAVLTQFMICSSGADVFRLPKLLVFEATGVVLLALIALDWIWNRPPETILDGRAKRAACLAGLIALWWTIATLTSRHPAVSLRVLPAVYAGVVFFVATVVVARSGGFWLIYSAVIAPALVNAAVVLFQASHLWNPFVFPADVAPDLKVTGFVGNPDDAGTYLAIGCITSTALALRKEKTMAIPWVAVAVYMLAAIVGTHSRGAVIAASVGIVAILAIRKPRFVVVAGTAALVVVGVVIMSSPSVRGKASNLASHPAIMFSGRLIPFLAAAQMAWSHPLVGVGPGCFGIEYFSLKSRIEAAHPRMAVPGHQLYFRETHNDHLQVAAEAGVIGYVLFLSSLIFLTTHRGRLWYPKPGQSEYHQFAALLAVPLALTFAILALVEFPLQIAAPGCAVLFTSAVCVAWSDR